MALLDAEFVLADLLLVENRLVRVADEMGKGKGDKAALTREQALLERLQAALEEGALLRDLSLEEADLDILRGYGLMTLKPVIVVLNASGDSDAPPELDYLHASSAVLSMRGRLEAEIAQLDDEDAREFMAEYGLEELAGERVIRQSYTLMGLHTFFTFTDKEVRAWALPIGATALDAAGAVHSDIARGFIRAEIAPYDTLMEAGGWAALKTAGKLQVEGKDYVMRDGDVMFVRFNV